MVDAGRTEIDGSTAGTAEVSMSQTGPRPVGLNRPSCRSWTPAGGPEAKLAKCAGSPSAMRMDLAPGDAVCGSALSQPCTTPARSAGRRLWGSSPGRGALSRCSWTSTAEILAGYAVPIDLSHRAGRSWVRPGLSPEACPDVCGVERQIGLSNAAAQRSAPTALDEEFPGSDRHGRRGWWDRHSQGQSAGAA